MKQWYALYVFLYSYGQIDSKMGPSLVDYIVSKYGTDSHQKGVLFFPNQAYVLSQKAVSLEKYFIML